MKKVKHFWVKYPYTIFKNIVTDKLALLLPIKQRELPIFKKLLLLSSRSSIILKEVISFCKNLFRRWIHDQISLSLKLSISQKRDKY